jgi:hypothetical protein
LKSSEQEEISIIELNIIVRIINELKEEKHKLVIELKEDTNKQLTDQKEN